MASLDVETWNVSEHEIVPPSESTTAGSSDMEKAFFVVSCCLSAAAILTNLVMGVSLIVRKNYNTFTVIVFHLVALDLAVGAGVVPLGASTHYSQTWRYGSAACNFWVTLSTFTPGLIAATCCVLNIERAVELTRTDYRQHREFWSWTHFLFIWLPWGILLAAGLPLFIAGIEIFVLYTGHFASCITGWKNQTYAIATPIVAYFLPSLASLVTLITTLCIAVLKSSGSDNQDTASPSLVSLFLVTISTFIMMSPFNILVFVSAVSADLVLTIPPWLFLSLQLVSWGSSAVRPLCWLADRDVRSGYHTMFEKCCDRGRAPPSDIPMR